MKSILKILFFTVFLASLSPPVLTQSQAQGIPSVNGWRFVPGASLIDSSKIKSYISVDNSSQIFSTYGKTTNLSLPNYVPYWSSQTTWAKDFPPFTVSDIKYLDCKSISGINVEKIKEINILIAIQNSNLYFFDGRFTEYNKISLNSDWKILSWDMKRAKDSGMNSFTKFYIAFMIVTVDSCYVGVDIEVRDLRGYYNDSQKTIVYDSFSGVTKVSEDQIPTGFVLNQNYPNPFNPTTTIRFSIPESGNYSLTVTNILGQKVAALIDNKFLAPGLQETTFNGSELPSGLYIYHLSGKNVNMSKKMMLIK